MLIVFLASLTATSLATLQQIAIRRSTVLQHQQQARLYTLGVEQWATLILIRDQQASKTDHLHEEWANLALALPVEGGILSGKMRDLQGCFNLNNLWRSATGSPTNSADPPERPPKDDEAPEQDHADPASEQPSTSEPPMPKDADSSQFGKRGLDKVQLQMLQRLLTLLELKPGLAQAMADWIDPDQDPLFPDGAEDSDYTVLNPPYLAANQPFSSVSELRLIKGVDRETYDKLAPLVCALPPGTALNVNTAPTLVLAALGEGMDPVDLERLREDQPATGYENVEAFLNAAKITLNAELKALLGVDSQYFLLRADAQVGDGHAVLYSILLRDEHGVRILRRSFGHQD
ncbi:MAG: type II secretion system minor pseudopilin GspK [Gammaproteobacteria bacterium]|nr:type II secretion system minor pseudopilin GspK [Gammaproteobacteria bacterium]